MNRSSLPVCSVIAAIGVLLIVCAPAFAAANQAVSAEPKAVPAAQAPAAQTPAAQAPVLSPAVMATPAPSLAANPWVVLATSSVVAAIVTFGGGWFRDSRKAGRDGKFSALYVSLVLEGYADNLSGTISGSETYENHEGQFGKAAITVPSFPAFGDDIDWKAFGISQTTDTLTFVNKVESTRASLLDLADFDDDAAIEAMRKQAAALGLEAIALAATFRERFKLKPNEYEGDWNTKDHLTERDTAYKKREADREEMRRRREAKKAEEAAAAAKEPAATPAPALGPKAAISAPTKKA